MAKSRSSWLVVAALLVAVGLSVVGLHAWRERGVWLRGEPGRFHACIEVKGGDFERLPMPGSWIVVGSTADAPAWQLTRFAGPTPFRRGYLQFALPAGASKEALASFPTSTALQLAGSTAGSLGILDETGEVIRVEFLVLEY